MAALRSIRYICLQNASTSAFQCPSESSSSNCPRPFDQIPSASSSIPWVGSIFKLIAGGGAKQLHEYCDFNFKRFGPMYREKIGTVEAVYIGNGRMMRQVFAQEDSTPGHFLPEPWLIYNQQYQVQRGLLFLYASDVKSD